MPTRNTLISQLVTKGTSQLQLNKGVGDIGGAHNISTHKPTATRHILQQDYSNKYTIHKDVGRSIEHNGMIPFLRDHHEKYTLGKHSLKQAKRPRNRSEAKKIFEKEKGWNSVGFPISFHNEKNFYKIRFEDI
mmetsp:Transcript_32294/g.31715  ORF Transcript_32294/g.31715 Transcript_32294/m.31715 type:complete len:133 (+) Transcript_32294:614-1012(+)